MSDVCGEFGGINLGHIVLVRAMWPPDDAYHMASAGAWAGHRFDVVVKLIHEKAMAEGPTWKDITQEAISGMRKMWEKYHELNKFPKVSAISHGSLYDPKG